MNKHKRIFSFSDAHLHVYRVTSGRLSVEASFDLKDPAALDSFSQTARAWSDEKACLLLNLPGEEYYEETLPHVTGKDRALMVERKIGKLFPDTDYVHYQHLRREKTGRRDDIYFVAGVPDTNAIDAYLDVLVASNVEIVGTYSVPMLLGRAIKPIRHDTQVLVVSIETEDSRLSLRQTFIDRDRIAFSRHTALAATAEDIAPRLREDVERTWQFLNSRRQLEPNTVLQVLLIVPPTLQGMLTGEPPAAHCRYEFVDPALLAGQHELQHQEGPVGITSLAAYLVGKQTRLNPHYHPEKLLYYRRHQQVRRGLATVTAIAALITLSLGGSNMWQAYHLNRAAQQLTHAGEQEAQALDTMRESALLQDVSPEEMRDVVTATRTLSATNPMPGKIFTLVSKHYADFSDLSLTLLEWRAAPGDQATKLLESSASDQSTSSVAAPVSAVINRVAGESANSVVITLGGEITSFAGNYRQVIGRIQAFARVLDQAPEIEAVRIHQLPLNIDPSAKLSRSLADQTPPAFVLKLLLHPGAL